MLTPQQAEQTLLEHSPPGELWPLHCRQVAKVAARVAKELEKRGCQVSADEVEAQALVHDIGRSKTHGPMHGWSGFTLLRALGQEETGRGCITHWLKGRAPEDLLASNHFSPAFVKRIFAALNPPEWCLGDSVLSFADSCVMHTTIVSLAERHEDLLVRYGDSPWMNQARTLAEAHENELSLALDFPVEDLVSPLHGDKL